MRYLAIITTNIGTTKGARMLSTRIRRHHSCPSHQHERLSLSFGLFTPSEPPRVHNGPAIPTTLDEPYLVFDMARLFSLDKRPRRIDASGRW